MSEGPLGRLEPTDWGHVERYPLSALPEPPRGVPSPIGVNWYAEFDRPAKGSDRRWRVAVDGRLTRLRGGHCVVVPPRRFIDPASWWTFYNQGAEGACVGFGISRAMSLLNRRRYDARWLYHVAQHHDEYPQTPPEEGTSVRAGLDILRNVGHRRVWGNVAGWPNPVEGISANRWATNIDEWLLATGWEGADEVPLLNSWGRAYPHVVWVRVDPVLTRLLREDGEFSIITDR